jgi:hypothetical protein
MGMVAIGGGTKQFFRAFTGNAQYMPDATTIGSRSQVAAGDDSINVQCDGVTQASGEGFIVPPGQPFHIRFTGWTNAACVIQQWNPFNAAWETIYDWSDVDPDVLQTFILQVASAIRIGALTIGADGATLECLTDFNQSDRSGF